MFPDEDFCGNCGLPVPGARRADVSGRPEVGRGQPGRPAPPDLTTQLGQVTQGREASSNGQSPLGGSHRTQPRHSPAAPTFTASSTYLSPQQAPPRAPYQPPHPPDAGDRVASGGAASAFAGPAADTGNRGGGGFTTEVGATGASRADARRAAGTDRTYRSISCDDKEFDARSAFDPLTNNRFLRNLALRFVLYAVAVGLVDGVIVVFASAGGGLRGTNYLETVFPLSMLVVVVLFCVLPVPAMVGQWTRLLTYRAPLTDVMLDRIRQSFDRHATPCDGLRTRMMTPRGEDRRCYLELKDGIFTGYISCFAHGNDLYIAWTFLLRVSPIRVALMRLGGVIQKYSGRGGDLYQTLRWESAKASVGAIHACTLDGISAALVHADGGAMSGKAAAGKSPTGSAPARADSADTSVFGLPGIGSR